MNLVCCAVYDKKAQAFLSPLFYSDFAQAERAFVAVFLSPGATTISQWPDDFDLYHLGGLNPSTGELLSAEHPTLVITGQSALLALDRMRRPGGELSGGPKLAPPEDSGASAERNKTTASCSHPNTPDIPSDMKA